MLPQERMVERLRRVCREDPRLVAAMLYGSIPMGEWDAFSDIDCILYFQDESLPVVDQRAWVAQIAPIELYYINEFGVGVAIFENLIRGEFHFDLASEMAKLEALRGTVWFPSVDAALLLDRTGELAQHLQGLVGAPPERNTPDTIRYLSHSFLNWTLFGGTVLARGERARALEILRLVHDNLLLMVRLKEGSTGHWIRPTGRLESEISVDAYTRFAACTATLENGSLEAAYASSWEWGKKLAGALAQEHSILLPNGLIEKMDRRLGEGFRGKLSNI